VNNDGQLNIPSPNSGYTDIAAGLDHSLGLRTDGSVAGWGYNQQGQCTVPEPNSGFRAVAAGGLHSLGLKEDGSVVGWGDSNNGLAIPPSPNSGFVAIACGTYHNLALREDGSLAAWGSNASGQCTVPSPNNGFVAIAAGGAHSLALRQDGSLAVFGHNLFGQGVLPDPNTGFVAVAAGTWHSVALRADGSLVAWGRNTDGQCTPIEADLSLARVDAAGNWTAGLSGTPQTGLDPGPARPDDLQTLPVIQRLAPNPFNPTTRLDFRLAVAQPLVLEAFNLRGQRVHHRALGTLAPGEHSLSWTGRDDRGRDLASGLYLLRLSGPRGSSVPVRALLVR
jgi:alpha-tubulin suppressor-like RCC1 family protein